MVSGILFNSKTNGLIVDDYTNSSNLETTYEYSNWWWTDYELISTESTLESKHLNIAADSVGNIHIVWADLTAYLGCGSDSDIFYKYWDATSDSWSTTEVVSTESTSYSSYPALAVDSTNKIHIVWIDTTDYAGAGTDLDIFYKSRSSEGLWSITEVVSPTSDDSLKPSIAVDSADNLHLVWQDITDYLGSGTDSDVFYRIRPSGSIWSTTEVVSSGSTGSSYNPFIVVNSLNTAYITWQDTTDYLGAGTDWDIFYRFKTYVSGVWSFTGIVSAESTLDSAVPSMVVDSADNIHCVWYDSTDYSGSGTDVDIFYKYRDVSSYAWTTTEVVSTESTDNSFYAFIDVDSTDTLHLVWKDETDYLGSGSDVDVFYKYRDASSGSWSLTSVVTTESTTSVNWGVIAVDNLDNIHVSWEVSGDFLGSGTDWDIYHKKFVGPPSAPEFLAAAPNYSTTGSISLNWSDVRRTDSYYLYRETTYMTSSIGLTPIVKINDSNFVDTIDASGTYYYAVIAENEYGNSSLSPVEDVQVDSTNSLLPFLSNELLIVAGILLGTQIIFFIISILIKKPSGKSTAKSSKKKK
ncbi:MAG: hypothetical protein KGD64_05490 [Candidatus Heimdallarchaeota archaeon]|nr:hypothetical protein [Candidatus Heimdallarchaeota archaeon]